MHLLPPGERAEQVLVTGDQLVERKRRPCPDDASSQSARDPQGALTARPQARRKVGYTDFLPVHELARPRTEAFPNAIGSQLDEDAVAGRAEDHDVGFLPFELPLHERQRRRPGEQRLVHRFQVDPRLREHPALKHPGQPVLAVAQARAIAVTVTEDE